MDFKVGDVINMYGHTNYIVLEISEYTNRTTLCYLINSSLNITTYDIYDILTGMKKARPARDVDIEAEISDQLLNDLIENYKEGL